MAKTIYRPEYRDLVERLRLRRERLAISQSELALRLGWKQQKVSMIESGARRLDVLEYLAVARALNLTPGRALALAADPGTAASPAGRRPRKRITPGPKPRR